MRRRRSADEVTPSDLLVFDGFQYRTERAWSAAFDEFLAAREAWSEEHPGSVLAQFEVNGHCPFDHSRFRKSTG